MISDSLIIISSDIHISSSVHRLFHIKLQSCSKCIGPTCPNISLPFRKYLKSLLAEWKISVIVKFFEYNDSHKYLVSKHWDGTWVLFKFWSWDEYTLEELKRKKNGGNMKWHHRLTTSYNRYLSKLAYFFVLKKF